MVLIHLRLSLFMFEYDDTLGSRPGISIARREWIFHKYSMNLIFETRNRS